MFEVSTRNIINLFANRELTGLRLQLQLNELVLDLDYYHNNFRINQENFNLQNTFKLHIAFNKMF